MKSSLTIIATTTNSFNVLTAIKQIQLGFVNSPLVLEFFPNGYENDLSSENLTKCFKRLNDEKVRLRKAA